jgi:hypothetical protein
MTLSVDGSAQTLIVSLQAEKAIDAAASSKRKDAFIVISNPSYFHFKTLKLAL